MIYLDNSATTKPYPEVIETITDVLTKHWGNSGAPYEFGDDAKRLINEAIQLIADDINCSPEEIIFTSGACEANTLAIMGTLEAHPHMFLFTSRMEHASIAELSKNLSGHPFFFLENDLEGFLFLGHLETQIRGLACAYNRNFLVSICGANSEIGVKQDIKAISKIVHKYGGLLHVDATQLWGEERLDVKALGIDLMSVSAQKIHGPKGVGALYVRNGIRLKPIIYGSQQGGIRAGTLPTHLICGFAKALEITRQHNASDRVNSLRNRLLNQLMKISNVHLNGPEIGENRLVNNISLTVKGVSAESLVTQCGLLDICIAKGSACQSHEPVPSATLKAIDLTDEESLSTIRITLDEFNTDIEVDRAAEIITKIIERMRSIGNEN